MAPRGRGGPPAVSDRRTPSARSRAVPDRGRLGRRDGAAGARRAHAHAGRLQRRQLRHLHDGTSRADPAGPRRRLRLDTTTRGASGRCCGTGSAACLAVAVLPGRTVVRPPWGGPRVRAAAVRPRRGACGPRARAQGAAARVDRGRQHCGRRQTPPDLGRFAIGFDERDRARLHELWDEVITSQRWSEGPLTERFEAAWSA